MPRVTAASIAQILDMPFPRPRKRENLNRHPEYQALKVQIEKHFSRETLAVVEEVRVCRVAA